MQAPSPPSSGPCLFFRLSLELRLLIYEHVLRYEKGLAVHFDTRKCVFRRSDTSRNTADILPNPLSLVCRQLYNETRGLLIFESNREVDLYCTGFTTPSSYVFIHFTQYIGTVAVRRLRKITVSGAKNTNVETLSWENACSYFDGFKLFCAANPDTIVVIRFAEISGVDAVSWLPYCLSISRIIRYTDSAFVIGDKDPWMKFVWGQLGHAVVDLLDLPPNLRFSVLSEFLEHGIKQLVEDTTIKEIYRDIFRARRMWEEGI